MADPLFLGIDLGGTKTAVSLLSEADGVLEKRKFETTGGVGPEAGVERIIEAAKSLAVDHDVSAIGLSVGAMFDPADGCIGAAPHLPDWEGYPLVAVIEAALALPVGADNDANACALAEWKYGAGRGTDHMAFCTFGTGFGAGLILNGRLYRGASNLAGEIGATLIAEDGPPVRGKPGCLEGYASGAGIAGLVEWMLPEYDGDTSVPVDADAETVVKQARAGDPFALAVLGRSSHALGRGMAVLVDLLNLEAVVIGSIFVRAEDLLRPPMEEAFERFAMDATRGACRIVPAELGEEIGDYAALVLAREAHSK